MQEDPPFQPPYELGANGCVVVGVWRARGATAPPVTQRFGVPALQGVTPLRVPGGALGMAFVLDYDRPAAAHPVRYREIIAAYAVRRGIGFAAVPFDLVLDEPFNVEAGREHYHLPKRLDRSLTLTVERDAAGTPTRVHAHGEDVTFRARLDRPGGSTLPSVTSAALREMTKLGPVLGVLRRPTVATEIPLRPKPASGQRAHVERLTIGEYELRPIHARYWGAMDITLGRPTFLSDG